MESEPSVAERTVSVVVEFCTLEAECCAKKGTTLGPIAAVPFLLFEDLLDCSSAQGCERWWSVLEKLGGALTSRKMFVGTAKFVLLRLSVPN